MSELDVSTLVAKFIVDVLIGAATMFVVALGTGDADLGFAAAFIAINVWMAADYVVAESRIFHRPPAGEAGGPAPRRRRPPADERRP